MPAVRLISFPFRLQETGAVAGVEQGSDTWVEECIAQAMLTKPGERVQVPTFGVSDPAFVGFQVGVLQRHLNDFGPPVVITEMKINNLVDGREEVTIAWRRSDNDQQQGGVSL